MLRLPSFATARGGGATSPFTASPAKPCYAELDLDRWFLDGDPFELLRMRRVAERIADLHVFDTRERQDVSGERFGDRHALECFEAVSR